MSLHNLNGNNNVQQFDGEGMSANPSFDRNIIPINNEDPDVEIGLAMPSPNVPLRSQIDENIMDEFENVIVQDETASELDESECMDAELQFEDTDEGIETEQEARQKSLKPKKLQLSIYHVDIRRVDNAINDKRKDTITNSDRVKYIVDHYNRKHSTSKVQKEGPAKKIPGRDIFRRKTENSPTDMDTDDGVNPDSSASSSARSPTPIFKRRSEYEARMYIDPQFSSSEFELKIYSQKNEEMDDETGELVTSLSKIRFLLHKRKAEIFALPSSFARYVVQEWADTKFPLSIASAILMEKSTDAKTIKGLVSNRYFSKYRMRNKESLTQSSSHASRFSPQICTSFTATVKNSEIKDMLQVNRVSELKLQTGFDSIKFSAGTDMKTYGELCSILLDIHNDVSLERSREYRGYFTQVNCDVGSYLDSCVLEDLEKLIFYNALAVKENVSQLWSRNKLDDFQIFQKNFEKYLKAEKYCVSYERKKSNEHTSVPSFKTLCKDIKYRLAILSPRKTENKEFLKKLKLSCTFPGKKPITENFIGCLEGIYYDESRNENFWKMSGRWYQVLNSYIYDIEVQFKEFLSQHSISPQTNKHLYKPITFKGKNLILESDYNNMYADHDNYIVGDDICVLNKIELFDIMEFCPENYTDLSDEVHDSPSPFIYYHVKKEFNSKAIRILGNQILQAASLILDSIQGHSDRSALKLLHEKYTEDGCTENFISMNFGDFNTFLQASKNATFVYAMINNRSYQSLKKTYCFDFATSPEEFASLIRGLSTEDRKKLEDIVVETNTNQTAMDADEKLALTLFNLMTQEGYIDKKRNFTQKWFYCRSSRSVRELEQYILPHDFKLQGLKTNDSFKRDNVEKHITELFVTSIREFNFVNLTAKMVILSLWEELMEMRFKFKILEIPVAPIGSEKDPPKKTPRLS